MKVRKNMKNGIVVALLMMAWLIVMALTGCSTEAERVSYNLSQQADTEDNQLEIVVEDENGEYKKHFIGLSDNVTYVVEDVTSGDVNQYKYTLNFNPKMWLPEISTIE
jgi:hypothetical protein|nr:MAG TPA: protein of unknown function (DUF4969) [Caudoviricetes sp.]